MDTMVFADGESTNLYVFVVGNDHRLHVRFWSEAQGWRRWLDLGAPDPPSLTQAGPSVVASIQWGPSGVPEWWQYVFALDNLGNVQVCRWDRRGWNWLPQIGNPGTRLDDQRPLALVIPSFLPPTLETQLYVLASSTGMLYAAQLWHRTGTWAWERVGDHKYAPYVAPAKSLFVYPVGASSANVEVASVGYEQRILWSIRPGTSANPSDWTWHQRTNRVPPRTVEIIGEPAVFIPSGSHPLYGGSAVLRTTPHELWAVGWDRNDQPRGVEPFLGYWTDLYSYTGRPDAYAGTDPVAIKYRYYDVEYTYVFFVDREGNLCEVHLRPDGWQWEWGNPHGRPPNNLALRSKPAAVSYSHNGQSNLYVFCMDEEDNLWERNWVPDRQTWEWGAPHGRPT